MAYSFMLSHMKISRRDSCPCGSGQTYEHCCGPFHEGEKQPKHAKDLMRSRYSAYELNLPDYIIETTHPQNPDYLANRQVWSEDIAFFSNHTDFSGLEILFAEEKGSTAYVTFRAILFQEGKDATITEKSIFERVDGKWLYKKGEINP